MHTDIREALPAFVKLVQAHLDAEEQQPVRPRLTPEEVAERIDVRLTEEGRPLGEVVEDLEKIMAMTPSTATPRFFNQLFGGRDGAAVLGEALAAVLNNSMYTYKVAGVHVLLELELVQRMGRMLGWDEVEGIFTPGGSLSNMAGMILGRNHALPELKDKGADGRALRVYTSEDSHYSVPKAAGMLGIGRDNVVRIPVDARGRMLPDALRAAIQQDKAAGHVPILINATSGTTVLGAFDPLEPIADISEAEGVWLHIDAAYGGTMLFHPELKERFAGISRADSVTWDAHKMMGVPLTCSVILTRHRGRLTRELNEKATYLFQDDTDDLNPGTRSLQCGRRNSTLKLWTAWRKHGDVGFRERMQTLRNLTLHARSHVVEADDLHLVREPESINLCFSVDGVSADRLCTQMNVRGRAMVGHAIVDDRPVVRAVFLDPTVGTDAIDHFFEALREVAADMREGDAVPARESA